MQWIFTTCFSMTASHSAKNRRHCVPWGTRHTFVNTDSMHWSHFLNTRHTTKHHSPIQLGPLPRASSFGVDVPFLFHFTFMTRKCVKRTPIHIRGRTIRVSSVSSKTQQCPPPTPPPHVVSRGLQSEENPIRRLRAAGRAEDIREEVPRPNQQHHQRHHDRPELPDRGGARNHPPCPAAGRPAQDGRGEAHQVSVRSPTTMLMPLIGLISIDWMFIILDMYI